MSTTANEAQQWAVGQLTRTDRQVIATVKAIAAACGEDGLAEALKGTAVENMHDGTYSSAREVAFGTLCADAEELVGIIRRLTGEDL